MGYFVIHTIMCERMSSNTKKEMSDFTDAVKQVRTGAAHSESASEYFCNRLLVNGGNTVLYTQCQTSLFRKV